MGYADLRNIECVKCGQMFEAMQRFSDPPLKECGCCHGRLRKLISMSAFHLKGSGWYTTDYARKNQSTAECKSETGEAKTDSTSPAKDSQGSAKGN